MPDQSRSGDDEPATGSTLAGSDVTGGSVLKPPGEHRPELRGGEDLLGERQVSEPEFAGTVAGNTTAAGAVVRKETADKPTSPEEDLGPEGTIVQEIGGEARH